MPDDLLQVLTRFHREVVVPDIERIVDARLDRLESEYQSLTAPFADSKSG